MPGFANRTYAGHVPSWRDAPVQVKLDTHHYPEFTDITDNQLFGHPTGCSFEDPASLLTSITQPPSRQPKHRYPPTDCPLPGQANCSSYSRDYGTHPHAPQRFEVKDAGSSSSVGCDLFGGTSKSVRNRIPGYAGHIPRASRNIRTMRRNIPDRVQPPGGAHGINVGSGITQRCNPHRHAEGEGGPVRKKLRDIQALFNPTDRDHSCSTFRNCPSKMKYGLPHYKAPTSGCWLEATRPNKPTYTKTYGL
eukprot:NODE_1749_length_855_cov_45.286600_g1378_i0.p1 GENE.NODE_1749_length_855_cov_45.286600_g1378_i0~~NODE_1749_length_855_cov_45.286600_g1378_i0.p1  ORF type:complete len:249 (-),score=30.27 NODE_1749_length_855_cov_45.286600_g1378_i0:29-775(-)